MSKVFVECKWRILKFDKEDFIDLLRLSEVHDCDLWLKETRTFVDGYQVISIFVSADAEEIVTLFCEALRVYDYADLLQIGLSKLTQDLMPLPSPIDRRGSVQANDLIYFFETAAIHNQQVRDHCPVWVTALWVIKPIEAPLLEDIVSLMGQHSALVTYQIKALMHSEAQFYIRFLYPYEFVACMTTLRKLMRLRHWSVMFSPQSYKDVDYDKIEAYPCLTHDTIPAFLDAIKPHL